MKDEKSIHILKAAQYAEESGEASLHAQSFLMTVEPIHGFVFGVLSAHGSKESFEAVESIIHTHLERLADTVEATTNLTHRFEQLLQALNEDIGRAFEEGTFSLSINDTSSVIGIADEQLVIVSGFGSLAAQFLHKSEKERYEVYDLGRGMRVEEEMPSWKKPFLTVLDGELRSGDVLYLGARLSRHDIAPGTLNDVLTTLPPNSAVSKIRQYLPQSTTFATVVLKAERIDEPLQVSSATAEASLEQLDRTTSKTDKFLSEQKPEVRGILMKVWRFLFPSRGAEMRRKMLRRLVRFLWRMIVVVITIAGKIVVGLAVALFLITKRIVTEPRKSFSTVSRLGKRFDLAARAVISKFNSLPKTSKYILLGIVGVAFVLVSGLVLMNKQQTHAAEREAFNQSVEAIEKKIENAEASLIYGNEEQAASLLAEAMGLVEGLPTGDDEDRASTTIALKEKIAASRNELRHLTVVSPETIVTSETALNALVNFNGTTYAVSDTGSIFAVNTTDKSIAEVSVTKGEVGAPKATTTSDNAVYWLDDGLSRYIPESGQVTPLSVSREGLDLAYYAGKMYILSPATGQIYRHQSTASGFDGGSAWVVSGVSTLTDGTAIAIDGYIWVLKADGTIVRFLSGKETDWKATQVDPPLLRATELWTNETSTTLYILDPVEGRVVLLNKDKGTLIAQYQNDAFKGAKSMIVDEIGKTITVLSNNTISRFGF